MLHTVKTTNSIIKRTPLLCGLLFAAILSLLPISAQAQCTNWDASGRWRIIQQGAPFPYNLVLEQKGRVITGTVDSNVWVHGLLNDTRDPLNGTVDGTIDGNSFSIQIFWDNDQTGVYNGKVLPSGRLDGEGYEKRSPNVRVSWHSDGVLKCAPPPVQSSRTFSTGILRSTASPSPTPKPKSSGKMPKSEAAPPKPPFITSGQMIIQPYVPFASVYLGWDGGPDNPNVEVFVSIDNGPETPAFTIDLPPGHPLFKQPKASIELKLQKGRTYKFALKAGGATLSTVSFYVPSI